MQRQLNDSFKSVLEEDKKDSELSAHELEELLIKLANSIYIENDSQARLMRARYLVVEADKYVLSGDKKKFTAISSKIKAALKSVPREEGGMLYTLTWKRFNWDAVRINCRELIESNDNTTGTATSSNKARLLNAIREAKKLIKNKDVFIKDHTYKSASKKILSVRQALNKYEKFVGDKEHEEFFMLFLNVSYMYLESFLIARLANGSIGRSDFDACFSHAFNEFSTLVVEYCVYRNMRDGSIQTNYTLDSVNLAMKYEVYKDDVIFKATSFYIDSNIKYCTDRINQIASESEKSEELKKLNENKIRLQNFNFEFQKLKNPSSSTESLASDAGDAKSTPLVRASGIIQISQVEAIQTLTPSKKEGTSSMEELRKELINKVIELEHIAKKVEQMNVLEGFHKSIMIAIPDNAKPFSELSPMMQRKFILLYTAIWINLVKTGIEWLGMNKSNVTHLIPSFFNQVKTLGCSQELYAEVEMEVQQELVLKDKPVPVEVKQPNTEHKPVGIEREYTVQNNYYPHESLKIVMKAMHFIVTAKKKGIAAHDFEQYYQGAFKLISSIPSNHRGLFYSFAVDWLYSLDRELNQESKAIPEAGLVYEAKQANNLKSADEQLQEYKNLVSANKKYIVEHSVTDYEKDMLTYSQALHYLDQNEKDITKKNEFILSLIDLMLLHLDANMKFRTSNTVNVTQNQYLLLTNTMNVLFSIIASFQAKHEKLAGQLAIARAMYVSGEIILRYFPSGHVVYKDFEQSVTTRVNAKMIKDPKFVQLLDKIRNNIAKDAKPPIVVDSPSDVKTDLVASAGKTVASADAKLQPTAAPKLESLQSKSSVSPVFVFVDDILEKFYSGGSESLKKVRIAKDFAIQSCGPFAKEDEKSVFYNKARILLTSIPAESRGIFYKLTKAHLDEIKHTNKDMLTRYPQMTDMKSEALDETTKVEKIEESKIANFQIMINAQIAKGKKYALENKYEDAVKEFSRALHSADQLEKYIVLHNEFSLKIVDLLLLHLDAGLYLMESKNPPISSADKFFILSATMEEIFDFINRYAAMRSDVEVEQPKKDYLMGIGEIILDHFEIGHHVFQFYDLLLSTRIREFSAETNDLCSMQERIRAKLQSSSSVIQAASKTTNIPVTLSVAPKQSLIAKKDATPTKSESKSAKKKRKTKQAAKMAKAAKIEQKHTNLEDVAKAKQVQLNEEEAEVKAEQERIKQEAAKAEQERIKQETAKAEQERIKLEEDKAEQERIKQEAVKAEQERIKQEAVKTAEKDNAANPAKKVRLDAVHAKSAVADAKKLSSIVPVKDADQASASITATTPRRILRRSGSQNHALSSVSSVTPATVLKSSKMLTTPSKRKIKSVSFSPNIRMQSGHSHAPTSLIMPVKDAGQSNASITATAPIRILRRPGSQKPALSSVSSVAPATVVTSSEMLAAQAPVPTPAKPVVVQPAQVSPINEQYISIEQQLLKRKPLADFGRSLDSSELKVIEAALSPSVFSEVVEEKLVSKPKTIVSSVDLSVDLKAAAKAQIVSESSAAAIVSVADSKEPAAISMIASTTSANSASKQTFKPRKSAPEYVPLGVLAATQILQQPQEQPQQSLQQQSRPQSQHLSQSKLISVNLSTSSMPANYFDSRQFAPRQQPISPSSQPQMFGQQHFPVIPHHSMDQQIPPMLVMQRQQTQLSSPANYHGMHQTVPKQQPIPQQTQVLTQSHVPVMPHQMDYQTRPPMQQVVTRQQPMPQQKQMIPQQQVHFMPHPKNQHPRPFMPMMQRDTAPFFAQAPRSQAPRSDFPQQSAPHFNPMNLPPDPNHMRQMPMQGAGNPSHAQHVLQPVAQPMQFSSPAPIEQSEIQRVLEELAKSQAQTKEILAHQAKLERSLMELTNRSNSSVMFSPVQQTGGNNVPGSQPFAQGNHLPKQQHGSS